MTTRLTATSLLSRSLLRCVTLGTRYPLGLEPSPRIPQPPSRTASGDPLCQEQTAPAMDSPIKVVSNIGGGGGRGAGGGFAAIDAGRSARKPLSLWPGMYHSPVTNALWARSTIFELMMDASTNGSDQQQRSPTEVRIGKLLEDLDALAGTIAVKVLK
jgi:acyl-coenzyme A thioesterase 9